SRRSNVDAPVTLSLHEKLLANPQQPRTVTCRHQRLMEARVRQRPVVAYFVDVVGSPDQGVIGRDDRDFPIDIAMAHRAPKTFQLDIDADFGEVADVSGIDRGHAEAALRLG